MPNLKTQNFNTSNGSLFIAEFFTYDSSFSKEVLNEKNSNKCYSRGRDSGSSGRWAKALRFRYRDIFSGPDKV